MLNTSLRELLDLWKSNPGITQTELVSKFGTSSQNIDRWMRAIALGKSKGENNTCRYVPLYGVELTEIKQAIPGGLTERQRIDHCIKLGYNNYSIALHLNILLAPIEKAQEELKKEIQPTHEPSSFAKASTVANRLRDASPRREAMADGQQLTIPKVEEDAQSEEDRVYEYGQDDKYPEYGDKQSHHLSEITRATLFPNGIPTCLPCQRSILYTDIIHCNNNDWKPLYPHSYLHTNAEPKIIFPQAVSYHHMNQWAQYVEFPLTGNKDIDDMRILEAFVADATANFLRNRMTYIARKLIEGKPSSIEDYRKAPYVPK